MSRPRLTLALVVLTEICPEHALDDPWVILLSSTSHQCEVAWGETQSIQTGPPSGLLLSFAA